MLVPNALTPHCPAIRVTIERSLSHTRHFLYTNAPFGIHSRLTVNATLVGYLVVRTITPPKKAFGASWIKPFRGKVQ